MSEVWKDLSSVIGVEKVTYQKEKDRK